MKQTIDVVTNQNGQPVPGASVGVYTNSSFTSLATLYSDDGVTPIANPLTTDSLGAFNFFVADGRYYYQISGPGLTTLSYPNSYEIADVTQSAGADANWNAININDIVYAGEFAGSTADVQINAALATLPAGGGVVDCRSLTGAQTIAAPIAITVPVTLLFSPNAVFTQQASILVTGTTGVKVYGHGATFILENAASFYASTNNRTDGTNGYMMWQFTNATKCHIEGCIFDGNVTNNTSNGYDAISFYGCTDCHVVRNRFQNIGVFAVLVTSNGETTPSSSTSSNIWVSENSFDTCGSGALFDNGGAFALQNGNNVSNAQGYWFQRNQINNSWNAVDMTPQSGNLLDTFVLDNYITNGANTGWYNIVVEEPVSTPHTRILIRGNHMLTALGTGIFLSQGDGAILSDNIIDGMTADGILIGVNSATYVVQNSIVKGNQIRNCANGIYCVAASTNNLQDLVITDNVINGCGTGIDCASSAVLAGFERVTVINNDTANNTTSTKFLNPYPAGMNAWLSSDTGAAQQLDSGVRSKSLLFASSVGGTFTVNLGYNDLIDFTLGGNATIAVGNSPPTGARVTFVVQQAASGGPYTLTWPSSFHGGMTVSATASKYNIQTFQFTGTIYIGETPNTGIT
jgi:Right handed beta helix region